MSMKVLVDFSSVQCCEKLNENGVVVIERSILDIASNLPKVVYRKRYGI